MNSNCEIIANDMLGLKVYRKKLKNGLTVMMCPMEGFSTSSAIFGARVGSIDNSFKYVGEDCFTDVPSGIAHYLEHKMFESSEGDAFERFAKTGASANAYTTFDRTAYYFNCTDNFLESLEILLDMVSKPYFTKETVEKEQGIIGQEIKMYEDNPDWCVFFNLLTSLYEKNSVRLNIAGTVESIAKIDAELLYRCYYSFYNPANMVLAVAGNVNVEEVLATCEKVLPKVEPRPIEVRKAKEPEQVYKTYIEEKMEVALPIFNLGFKAKPGNILQNTENAIYDEVLTEIICGTASDWYQEMFHVGLINSSFSSEVLSGRDYFSVLFSGESSNPEAVVDELKKRIKFLQENGIEQKEYERSMKLAYGRYIAMYTKPAGFAGVLMQAQFNGVDNIFSILEGLKTLTKKDLEARLNEDFVLNNTSLSVVLPKDEKGIEEK